MVINDQPTNIGYGLYGVGSVNKVTNGSSVYGANKTPTPSTTTPQDPVDVSDAGKVLSKAAEQRPNASDPFRAFKDKDGNISLQSIMEIEMLPPKLREAGKLIKEAQSLTKEISDMQEKGNADPEKLAALQAELQATMAALQKELDKLGLSEELEKRGMSLDQLVKSGLDGLKDLAGTRPENPVGSGDGKRSQEKTSLLQRALGAFGRQTG